MKRITIFFLLLYTVSSWADVVSLTYFMNGKKVDSYSYIYKDSKLQRCNPKNQCDVLFNRSKNYCKNLLELKNDEDKEVRIKWECPRYESVKNLKNYKILLTNEPAFSDYTFNLDKIFSTFEYSKDKNKIYFNNLNVTVGITPNNINIPADADDLIESIEIDLDKNNYITREVYNLKNKNTINRVYIYQGKKIIKIIDTVTNSKKKKILLTQSNFTYK